jgi:hypothetical protein
VLPCCPSRSASTYAIYALCRLADDIVDLPNGQYPVKDSAEPSLSKGPLSPIPCALSLSKGPLSPLPCALSLSKGQTPRLQQAQPTPQLNQISYQPSLTRHFRNQNH